MQISFRLEVTLIFILLLTGLSNSDYVFVTSIEDIEISALMEKECLLLMDEGRAVIRSETQSPVFPIYGEYDRYGPIPEGADLYIIFNPLNRDLSDIYTLSKIHIKLSGDKTIINGFGSIDEEVRLRGAEAYKLNPLKPPKTLDFMPPRIEYNPLIDSLIDRVNEYENYKVVDYLSQIPTRYSFSSEISQARYFIRDKLREWGYDSRVFTYQYDLGEHCWIQDLHRLPDRSEIWFPMKSGYVFHSDDNGNNFDRSQSRVIGAAIYFLDSNRGWIAGYHREISRTSDGTLWQTIDTGFDYHYLDIHFLDENTGFMTTKEGQILKTNNSGDTWYVAHNISPIELHSITFINQEKGFVCGDAGTLLKTEDGGDNWSEVDIPNTDAMLRKVFFLNENVGWIVGFKGTILHTEDGGETWEIQREGDEYLIGVDFKDSQEGWCCGIDVIFHTTDGGETWEEVESDTPFGTLFGISSLRYNTLFAVGVGRILRSEDGGETWEEVNLGEFGKLNWKNVVGSKMGYEYPDEEVILVAHYDSISNLPWDTAPGADDNASGTSAVLTIAKALRDVRAKRTIRYLLVSGEEQGLWGSRAYAEWARENDMNIVAVLNMDMIAYLDEDIIDLDIRDTEPYTWLGDYIYEVGKLYLPEITIYPHQEGSGGSDHIPFWENGYPAICNIEHPGDHWYPYYHTTEDRIEHLNFNYQSLTARLNAATALTLIEPISLETTEDRPKVVVFPNPYRADSATSEGIIFAGVGGFETLSIYSISGDLIEKIDIEGRDSVLWPVSGSNDIESGIYLWVIGGNDGRLTGKVAIIK